MSRWCILFPSFLLFSSFSYTQNISGVVNSYYRVTEVIPAKACVRLNTTAGLGLNDKTLLIQMKGASINTSDAASPSFGDTTSLNDAGNYETGTICYIRSDSVFFIFNLINQYTIAGKVQLVKIPQYYNATVVDTLRAAPWNNTNGTGGVLAIYVDNDLILNAPISVDSSGFRGGGFRLSGNNCNNSPGAGNYAYNGSSLSPQNGALKGEGVADVTTAQSGGRGAPANGGGGGNNHNNGGGGGANLSAGGDGGGNSSSGSGNCTLARQGKGGKPLTSYGGQKIFMGGGGGAGHVNNGYAVSNGGGHGGGIVFIRADNLISNNHKISANGQVGGPAASDGASGAGAGGTVILDINNYTDADSIQANGGRGGIESDGGNINYCYGAGGGGSGGVIYFTGAIPSAPVITTAGAGPAGPELGRDASCAAIVASLAGESGEIIAGYTYTSSLVFANTYCSVLLPVEMEWFNAQYTNGQAWLEWKIPGPESIDHFSVERSAYGNSWETIHDQPANPGTITYRDMDNSPRQGYNFYRIRVVKKNNATAYSTIRKIYVPEKKGSVTIYPNPAHSKILITGILPGSLLIISDISGKQAWQKRIIGNQSSAEVALPDLPAGMYIIKIDGIARQLVIR